MLYMNVGQRKTAEEEERKKERARNMAQQRGPCYMLLLFKKARR